jgi:hypothetical protein
VRKPNLFLVGGPKCGTTSLHEYLAAHPQIFMCTPKEPCYFDKDLPWPDSPRSETEYMRLFEPANGGHLIVGEASTNYLYSQVAVRNILRFNPEARFIAMVRNPIDMAMSLHSYSLQELTEDVEDFEAAWRLQDERRQGRRLPTVNYQPDFVLYGPFCRLGEQLQRLYGQVERSRVHVVVFDDLCADAAGVYRGTMAFLGLQDDGRKVYPTRNVTGVPRFKAVHRLLASLLALRQSLPLPRLGLDVFSRLKRLNVAAGARKGISADFRRELSEYFRSDVELLSALIERDLTSWLRSKSR